MSNWKRTQQRFSTAAIVLALSACATSGHRHGVELYAMPADLSQALEPADAHPARAAELAEAALHLLDPTRPGGPDYGGAARMCLLATEAADPRIEGDLERACYPVAARSALRSGDHELYVDAVDRWERCATPGQRSVGELVIHRAIRDRLLGEKTRLGRRVPRELRSLIPPVEDET